MPRADPRTVLLITSDTHRADHVRSAGDASDVATPTFAWLASRGIRYTDAWSSSHITLPSHAALMTGRTPLETGVDDNQTELVDAAPTLAEAFEAQGWLTLGAVSVNLLNDDVSNFAQGFTRYAEVHLRRRAPDTLSALARWLPSSEGRDVFCWLHVFDVHGPYEPAAEFLAPFWPSDADPFDARLPDPVRTGAVVPPYLEGLRDLDYVRALYKAEVFEQDTRLGALFGEGSRLRDAIVAFTSDHGEGHGEHDIWWAHKELYPEMLAVPLVIAWPGCEPAVRSDPVQQLDLGRTLLDLAGLEAVAFPGTNLVAAPRDDPPPRFALAAYARSAAVVYEGGLLIRYLAAHERGASATPIEVGHTELYDLAADPLASRDLAASDPTRRRALEGALDRWLERTERAVFRGTRHTDAATMADLAELGYVDAPAPEADPGDEEDGHGEQ